MQSWFWVTLLSGICLVVLFFSALHTHDARERIFKKKLRAISTNGPPPDLSDVADYFLRKKRSFRSEYFFYALYLAYTQYT